MPFQENLIAHIYYFHGKNWITYIISTGMKPTIKCPSCHEQKEKDKLTEVEKLLPFEGTMNVDRLGYLQTFIMIVNEYHSYYQWACDDCIKNGKAIPGDPKKQFYTFTYPWDVAKPYLAYFDKTYSCCDCKTEFVFSKEEQQFWYEGLSFIVYSEPKRCTACRKKHRDEKNLHKELSDLLRHGKPTSREQMLRISEIYGRMGKEEKMKKYRTEAKKLKS